MTFAKSSVAVVCLAVAALSVPSRALAQANPRIGTWKLNLEKSKFDPGQAPKSETRSYASTANGEIKLTAATVLADGTTQTSSYTAKFDGKEYPYVGPAGDSISIKTIDAYVTDAIVKRAGKVTQTTHNVVSKDGKTMTLTSKGTNASGKPFSSVRVYDKQ